MIYDLSNHAKKPPQIKLPTSQFFQSCLPPKMRLSVVLEGRYIGYQYINLKLLHFQDINRSLSFMRNNERLSDLRFICKDKVSVNVHSELFRQASPFMATLLDITKEKQVRTVYIFNLDSFVTGTIHTYLSC